MRVLLPPAAALAQRPAAFCLSRQRVRTLFLEPFFQIGKAKAHGPSQVHGAEFTPLAGLPEERTGDVQQLAGLLYGKQAKITTCFHDSCAFGRCLVFFIHTRRGGVQFVQFRKSAQTARRALRRGYSLNGRALASDFPVDKCLHFEPQPLPAPFPVGFALHRTL